MCVPHHLHEEYATAVMRSRRHLLLEKPIAHTMASAKRIVQVAATEGHDKACMLAEQMEYLPVLANVKRLVGTTKHIRYVFTEHNRFRPAGWRTQLECAGGGVLLDLGIHYVSFAVKAFGPIASHRKEVRSLIPGTDIPASERLSIRHVNGTEGEVDVAWAQENAVTSMDVMTATTTFTYRPGQRTARLGMVPQLVSLRSANGRLQMMKEYLSRCDGTRTVHDIADALRVLAAVL